MPKKLKRYNGHGDLHFITFSCYRRLALLGTARARNAFVRALEEVRSRYCFILAGYVVMPEHVHLLMGEPQDRVYASQSGDATTGEGSQGLGMEQLFVLLGQRNAAD